MIRREDDGNGVTTYANPYAAYDAILALTNGDKELEELSKKNTKQVLAAIEYNDLISKEKIDPTFRYVLQKRNALPMFVVYHFAVCVIHRTLPRS